MSKWRWSRVWLCGLAVAGCGGDDEKPAREPVGPVVEDASMSSDGEGTIRCAGELCELPPRHSLEQPCCVDPFAGGCGVMLSGTCQRISKRDERCPAVTPDGKMGEEAEEAGLLPCCASNGECGLDVGGGLGCVATSQACSLYPRDFIELLGSRTCDGEELEVPDDCGNR